MSWNPYNHNQSEYSTATIPSPRNNHVMHIYANPTPVYCNTQNSTTGPMVPMPNNVHPSQLLQSSCSGSDAPPSLRPPIRPSHHIPSSTASVALASARLNFGKTCAHRCSWRYSTIILTVVCLTLLALVIYLGAMNSLSIPPESSKVPCIVVEDLQSQPLGNGIVGTTVGTPSSNCLSLIPRDPIEFVELKLGTHPYSILLEPYESWSGWLSQPEAAFLRFNFTITVNTRMALLARKNEPPSLTAYHMLEVISHEKSDKLYKRNVQQSYVELLHYFEPGAWYFTIVNDIDDAVPLAISVNVAHDVPTSCPNNCHGHGNCRLGKCHCFPGYIGHDCADNVCPVLCNGRGRYLQGSCRCETGWKGPECDVRSTECEVTDCNGHGKCINGNCQCLPGFRGTNCEIVDCIDPICSGHGACIDGQCWCKVGWTGINCSDADGRLSKFFPNCSSHGVYDLDSGKCVCFHHWTGPNCDIAKCNLDCGHHGHCEGGRCHCDRGWHRPKCDEQICDARCLEHGQCNNGTCICIQGWMGKHCTLDGCPNGCSSHGDCVRDGEGWACKCRDEWGGSDCSAQQETNCADDIDNDNDGLSDCADSECCSRDHCRDSLMCIASPDPLDILLRKQPPAVTASFYQKMKFLIEESSVQSYAHKDEYSESQFWSAFKQSRVSVIRGQVISREGNGLIGIRVSVATDPQFGFTLTRGDGWFDILVNGGGAVTLQYQRNPFHPIKRTIVVSWNDIVVMPNPVVMSSSPDDGDGTIGDPFNTGVDVMISEKKYNQSLWHCMNHDYDIMRPVLYETLRPRAHGGCTETSAVIAETQVLQESLSIPGSHLHMVYHSSYSQGYLSTIHVQLTPSIIPNTLRLVHLRIIIEGILFEKTFEADADIKYTYAWNKRNIYKQKVYGIAIAKVFVGYEYLQCQQIIWTAISTTLRGYDMDISEFGSWNLDIHHRYNFHEGVLQKGDGTSIYFRQQPRVISVLMGNGHPRNLICGQECNGLARDNRLLSPISLTSGPDGSVYVGDANLIRRITPERQVYTVFKHKNSRTSYQYHVALSPNDGHLYVSVPERHQILRIHSLDKVEDPESNYDVVVGNGDRCFPHDPLRCGDGKPAPEARLIYPKGMAFATDNSLYFADGNNIRMVDSHGIVHTIIGDRNHRKQWKPIPCMGTLSVNEVKLHWPTHVAISPLEGSLYFIDDHMVLRLTHDRRVMIIAGQPVYCKISEDKRNVFTNTRSNGHNDSRIGAFTSFAFGPTGTLYLTEVTDDGVNTVRALTHDGELIHFAGKKSISAKSCPIEMCSDINTQNCACSVPTVSVTQANEFEDKVVVLARDIHLVSVTALTVTSDGVLHIADEGNLRILSSVPYIPQPDEQLEFQIAFPDLQELYIFNKYGQHTMTKSIITGRTLYTFLYNVNTSFGKLSAVTDASGNKVSFIRDSGNSLHTIETTRGQKFRIVVNKQGFLEVFVDPDNMTTKFTYDASGLLISRSDSAGQTFYYYYDQSGRLVKFIEPCGLITAIEFDFSRHGATVSTTESSVEGPERRNLIVKVRGGSVTTYQNGFEFKTSLHHDGSIELETPWNEAIYWDAHPHKVLLSYLPLQAGMFPVLTKQTIFTADAQQQWIGWDYDVKYNRRSERDKNVAAVERILMINDTQYLSIEYDLMANREILYNNSRRPFLFVQYDDSSRPVQWLPKESRLPLNVMYDRFGRMSGWQQGSHSETYSYDRMGHLSEIRFSDNTAIKYSFDDGKTSPNKILLRSGRKYSYTYDERGGIKSITTPKGTKHVFKVEISLGFYKLIYSPPGNNHNTHYVIYMNERQKPFMKVFPGESGKIIYVYNNRSQLQEIVYGGGKIERVYYSNGLLGKELWKYDDSEVSHEYTYTGASLTRHSHKFVSSYLLSNLVFSYHYDHFNRIKTFNVKVGSVNLPSIDFSYNQRTGKIETIGNFRFYDHTQNESFISDGIATYSKQFDAAHNLRQLSLVIADKEVFRMDMYHNSNGALTQSKTFMRHLGASKVRVQNYTYDHDGQLTEVTGRDHWKFSYDDNGNMATMQYMGNRIDILYDSGDRIVSFGETPYISDERGVVIQRGEERFYFNVPGQLLRATRMSRYDVRYLYDSRGRLTVRKDSYGNVTQYFYGDILRPNLVTHTFNNADGRVTTVIYDDNNVPIMTQVNHETFYLSCDQIRSPLLVFDHRGEVVKEILRGPYGHVLFDSNPTFYLPVDFQGGIPDPLTGLIHFSQSGVYDTLVGQWITPNWDSILSHLNDPLSLHLYRFNKNDPINDLNEERWKKLDLQKWIRNQGIELSAFDIGATNLMGTNDNDDKYITPALSVPKVSLPSIPILSGFACGVQKALKSFAMFSGVDKSKIKSEDLFESIEKNKISMESVPFGNGITLSRMNDRAIVQSIHDADQIRKDVFTNILNNSYLLDIHLVMHGHDVFYFVKDITWKASDDLTQLQRLGTSVNTTVHESKTDDSRNNQQVDLRIHSLGSILNIRYGTTPDKEKHRLLRHAKKHAISQRLAKERELLTNNWPNLNKWTETEKESIITTGTIPGYRGDYYHDPNVYPALSDDPSNIVFHKQKLKSQANEGTQR